MTDFVLSTIDETGVATLTLNRPEVHNAFNDEVIARMIEELEGFDSNEAVRVVILKSTGKNFSAGADLNWMKDIAKLSYEENIVDAGKLARLMEMLYRLSKPTIALVQGAAYGGAVGLAACCDVLIALDNARFCLSEVKIGLVPAVISPYVVQAMGERAARRYFITAEIINAEKALELGLAHEVVSEDQAQSTLNSVVESCLQNGPVAVAAAKKLVQTMANEVITDDIIRYSSELIAGIRVSQEGQEGLGAFLEKRAPNWKNA